MKLKYSQAFKEQALQKVLQRGDKTIQCIADELNINALTLKTWLKKERPEIMSTQQNAKRPLDWSPEERLQALLTSHGLEGEALSAFCRNQGLFSHHLATWKQDFIRAKVNQTPSDKHLRDEVQQLKQELHRKEKALAEAAALLILQKKFQAFWEEKAL